MAAGASEQRVNKRRGFGAAKDDQCADQQQHDDNRGNEISFVRHDEVEQFDDEGTATHGVGSEVRKQGPDGTAVDAGRSGLSRLRDIEVLANFPHQTVVHFGVTGNGGSPLLCWIPPP